MKNTPQRMVVEKALLGMKNHPSADEVYSEAVSVLPTISKATVYRILNAIAEEGKISKIRLPDGADRFEYRTKPHCHIICTVCGRVDDVEALFTPDKDWISDPKGYSVSSCMMFFEGICENCQKKNKEK